MATTAEGAVRLYSGSAVKTSLAQDINESVTTINVADASGYPAPNTDQVASIAIDRGGPNEEVIFYSTKNGTALQGCLRGQDGSVARQHRTGETVEHVSTSLDFREANAHVNDKTPSKIPHVQHVHKSVAQTIDANHTVTGSWTFSGPLDVADIEATSLEATTAALATITGPVAFTGAIAQRKAPAAPKKVSSTTGSAGTSDVLMREDAVIPFDARAILRATTPAGTIRAWSGSVLPTDEGHDGEWAFPDGATLDGSKYPAYKANIGTLYGGTASNPKLPNLAGRVLVSADANHAVAASGGDRTKKLGLNELPFHEHGITDPGHVHWAADYNSIVTGTASTIGLVPTATNQAAFQPGSVTREVTGIQKTGPTGSGNEFNIEQPWVGIRYIVKVH